MNRIRVVLAAVVLLVILSTTNVMAQDQTIAEIAAGNEDFSTLTSLVEAAGLTEVLSGEGPFTVFAPTNAAFAKLPQFLTDYLAANPELLTRVLTYHVISGAVTSDQITENMMVDSMEMGAVGGEMMGSQLSITLVGDSVLVDGARVVTPDVMASNGVIHAIDTVVFPAVELPAVDPLAISDNIVTAGSSTTFPVTQRMADVFNQEGYTGTITVDSIGTGAGFERFCNNAESDVQNASDLIRPEQRDACLANNRTPAEFIIAIDALAVVVSRENEFVQGLTLEELKQVFSGEVTTWDQLDPSYPAETIRLFSPGSDSGTYSYFADVVLEEDQTLLQNAPGIQFSEDDNVLVQGVLGSPYAIGYFGYAYYQENLDTLRALSIEGVEPGPETGASGEYPLARPLAIYSAPEIMQEKPQVAAFVNYYITNVENELGPEEDKIGYIPVSEFRKNYNKWVWLAATNTVPNAE